MKLALHEPSHHVRFPLYHRKRHLIRCLFSVSTQGPQSYLTLALNVREPLSPTANTGTTQLTVL